VVQGLLVVKELAEVHPLQEPRLSMLWVVMVELDAQAIQEQTEQTVAVMVVEALLAVFALGTAAQELLLFAT
jgi:hypothetical protein